MEKANDAKLVTKEEFEKIEKLRQCDFVEQWAKKSPQKVAIQNFDTQKEVTWQEFS